MNIIKKLMKLKKYNRSYFEQSHYIKYWENTTINENSIFLESQHGNNLNGNIFYILKELSFNDKYGKYTIYLGVDATQESYIVRFLKLYNIHNVKIVKICSKEYFLALSSCKYLFNDTSFLPFFIKKDEQVYVNTWHGTPLKNLGKSDEKEFHRIGNVQKNLLLADYLVFPSQYMYQHIVEDYMLENLHNGKVLFNGYTRNTIFFDKENIQKVKKQYHLNEYKTYAYMPTWRGVVGGIEDDSVEIMVNHLKSIDKKMNDNQIMYVNLHPFVSDDIHYDEFKHLKPFPKNIETYEFLSAIDCLITDYSSVFFDYAILNKKIILFTYDLEEYMNDRGLYFSLNELPFPQVRNVDELFDEMNSDIQYDDSDFLKKYCAYENKNATIDLLDTVLCNENRIETIEISNNGKENVVIYVGRLERNGITTSLINMLNNVDLKKRNYFITFSSRKVNKNKNMIKCFPEGVNYIPIQGKMNATLKEKAVISLYARNKISNENALPIFEKLYKYEIKRVYGDIKIDSVIQFTGYDYKKNLFYSFFDCNKVIYVHSNMVEEIKHKANQHVNALKYSYDHYDKVAVVTKDMIEPTLHFCTRRENIYVANNIIDYCNIEKKSLQEICFEEDTESNVDIKDLLNILNSSAKKMITIGRFSVEKGHIRLIKCFEKILKEYPDTYLIIIGGDGNKYEEIVEFVDGCECSEKIILIKNILNPIAILKKCDYFVLSSFYEALGLVIMEADIAGIPVISTDILGPRGFMNENGGTLVENSDQGVYHGLKLLLEDKVQTMNVDYKKYNENACSEFEKLLNNEDKYE